MTILTCFMYLVVKNAVPTNNITKKFVYRDCFSVLLVKL